MIKLTFCLTRLTPLTPQQFSDYWLNRHGPLVASVREVLRIRRYVQLHSMPEDVSAALRATRGGPTQFDGVAQLYWDSWDEMRRVGEDPRAAQASAALLEDERRFIDLARSPLWYGEERVIFG